MSTRALVALLLCQMIAGVVGAQSVVAPAAEFGRASGGEIGLITKNEARLSGSLGITGMTGSERGKRFDATLGGTALQDRLWFFASAQQGDTLFAPRLSTQYPSTDKDLSRAINTKLDMQIGSRQNLGASFDPASFLSLRYTGIVSDSMFFNATFSRR